MPTCSKNDESIFSDQPRRFITVNNSVKFRRAAGLEIQRRSESLFCCFELPMGESDSLELKRVCACVPDDPSHVPVARGDSSYGRLGQFNSRPRNTFGGHRLLLFGSAFSAQLLLGYFKNLIVDHSVQSELAVNKTGANVSVGIC